MKTLGSSKQLTWLKFEGLWLQFLLRERNWVKLALIYEFFWIRPNTINRAYSFLGRNIGTDKPRS